jgi:carboxypeptidase Q
MPGFSIRLMRPASLILALGLLLPAGVSAQSGAIPQETREAAQRLMQAALDSPVTWNRLSDLVDTFGARFAGTEALEAALDWILEGMEGDGLENVRAEPAMVPRWIRGNESLELLSPRPKAMTMLGLGPSVATPPQGIRAEVMVVGSFDELEARASEAQGKIVLFDVPFTTYGETVQYRGRGAVAAAKVGAVASMIRSVTPFSMNTPHTGGMSYEEGVPKIPHAAITLEDAAMLHRMADRGERIEVLLKMEGRSEGMVSSRNVMGEIRGSEFPDEIIVLGGHSDSWDVGQGAMDDAGGVVAAWEAIRLMKELGLRPRRTVRAVGWTAEEVGIYGGEAYAESPARNREEHILGIESDGGVFSPLGFGFTGSDAAFSIIQEIGAMLDPIGAGQITRGGGGADIGPMMRKGMPGMGLNVEPTRYFWYHHTDADALDKLDPQEVARCVAAMAVMAYVVADLPEPLPR